MSARQELRKWRADHPKTDLALGLVPGVGTALAVDDFIEDPTLLGAAGFLPYGSLLKKAKILRGIKAYHGTNRPIEGKLSLEHLGTGQGDLFGGPGIYATRRAEDAEKWNGPHLYEFDIPDDEVQILSKPLHPMTEPGQFKDRLKIAEQLRKKGYKTVDQPVNGVYDEDALEGINVGKRELLILDPTNVTYKKIK